MISKATRIENEERLRNAIESSHLGIWDWNLITNELYWDTGCRTMHGFPADAVSTIDDFWARVHPADRNRIRQQIEGACDPAHGGCYSVEYRTVCLPDVGQRWVLAQGRASFSRDGIPLRLIGTVVDMTRHKQMLNSYEMQLRREHVARESLEYENRVKDKFLAVLSHELRSPLNPILGWSRLLQTRQWDEATVAKALAIIEENARTQSQIIDDLLDIAKILHGKLHFDLKRVNVVAVIQAAINTVRSAAIAKSIDIHFTVEETPVNEPPGEETPVNNPPIQEGTAQEISVAEISVAENAIEGDRPSPSTPTYPLVEVSGDAVRLQQVVWNLLSNAVKFTPDGGQIHIQLRRVGDRAHITVNDTGKGINPEVLPHLFRPFYQDADDMAADRARNGGLGLGLMIVRQLVEAHGGTITADSPGKGCGAVFNIQLPLLPDTTGWGDATEMMPAMPNLTGLRVLVVDEDADNRELATIWLNQQGANVLAVSSTALVLPVLRTFRPHVYVGEIGFSDANGLCFMQQLRSLPREQGSQIPAIALTAYAGETYRQRAIASGYQRYLAKPCECEQLIQAVSELTNY